MSERLTALTHQIIEGNILSFDEMSIAFGEIMDGNASPAQMAAFSVGLKMRGETVGTCKTSVGMWLLIPLSTM